MTSVCEKLNYDIMVIYFNFLFLHLIAMEELDGDTVRLSSRGRYAERDIVQVRYFTICVYVLFKKRCLSRILRMQCVFVVFKTN